MDILSSLYVPAVCAVGLITLIPLIFKQRERSKPVKNSVAVQVAVQADLFFWRMTLYLPSTNFVGNMKQALKTNSESLKQKWKKNKSAFSQYYKTIPFDHRRQFVTDLMDELKQSLEGYFQKDDFSMHVLTAIDPNILLLLPSEVSQQDLIKKKAVAARIRESADQEQDKNKNKNKDNASNTRSLSNEAPAAKSSDSSSTGASSSDNKGIQGTDDEAAAAACLAAVARMFDDPQAFIADFPALNVLSAEDVSGQDLDPTAPTDDGDSGAKSANAKATEDRKTAALKEQVTEFLQTVRALVVVMLLHQFIDRYPVDKNAPEIKYSSLYRFLGPRAATILERIRVSLTVGVVVLVVMGVLQVTGLLDNILLGTGLVKYSQQTLGGQHQEL